MEAARTSETLVSYHKIIRRFIIVFTRAHQWSPTWTRYNHSTNFRPIFLKSILMSSSLLHLGLPISLFPSGFSTKTLYAFIMSHACYMFPQPCFSCSLRVRLFVHTGYYSTVLHAKCDRQFYGFTFLIKWMCVCVWGGGTACYRKLCAVWLFGWC